MKNITIAGRLGKAAELRRLQDGTPVLSFTVAVDDGWRVLLSYLQRGKLAYRHPPRRQDMSRPVCGPFDAEHLRQRLEYDPETGVFRWRSVPLRSSRKIGDVAGSFDYKGYVQISMGGRPYRAHRLAWLYTYGHWPAIQIDHINGDRADNRIKNLRLATNSQNNSAKGISQTNTSGYKGVSWNSKQKKWAAFIGISGKNKNLGSFDKPEEAALAYDRAAIRLFGEFANTNGLADV